MPELLERTFQILKAQQANIARIVPGLVVDSTTGEGDPVTLWGPSPDVIRLYDRPLRFMEAAALSGWERIITIMPLGDSGVARALNRNDRIVKYQVQFLTRLTELEMANDRQAVMQGVGENVPVLSPLAEKAHKLVWDFHHIFFSNLNLRPWDPVSNTVQEKCPQGLVDDADYDMSWDAGVDYPFCLFTAQVACQVSAWP